MRRLARAEGHLAAVRRMVEERRDCPEILIQLAAVRAALDATAKVVLADHIESCVRDAAHNGDAERVWEEAQDGQDLRRRLLDLPGIGDMKVRSLIAIVGKRFGVKPPGWEEVAPTHPTLGDVDSLETLQRYQDAKRAYKAKLRSERSAPTSEA